MIAASLDPLGKVRKELCKLVSCEKMMLALLPLTFLASLPVVRTSTL